MIRYRYHTKQSSQRSAKMEKKFKKEIESLENIFRFVEEFTRHNRLVDSIAFPIAVVVEELFTNAVKYNPQGQSDIGISLEKANNKVIIVIVDKNAQPFDITKTKGIDMEQPLHERKVGGLGIHLIKKFVDEIDYQFKDGVSIITLTKYLGR